MLEKRNIKDIAPDELKETLVRRGREGYRAGQILEQIFKLRKTDFEGIQNLPKDLRLELAKDFSIESLKIACVAKSKDGTRKYLFETADGYKIESVLIPEFDDSGELSRNTLCVSSQSGCAYDCAFCATGKLGFGKNLSAAEIVDQLFLAERDSGTKITNVVFMGMGEPLLNPGAVRRAIEIFENPRYEILNKRKITISTIGVVREIERMIADDFRAKLALSLHATTQADREKIIPAAKSFELSGILEVLEDYYREFKEPITYEYILFEGFNDTVKDVKRLAKIARRFPSKVNLIPWHSIEHAPKISDIRLNAASPERITLFAEGLRRFGVTTVARRSAGEDAKAACGQLALNSDKL